ncbi:MAG: hypothetical protein R3C68_03820 [Myxococcota bacterium]
MTSYTTWFLSVISPGILWTVALLFCGILLCPARGRADTGEVAVGFEVQGTLPAGGRLMATSQLGLSDWSAVRMGVGGEQVDEDWAGRGCVQLVAALDVLAWVPELSLGVAGTVGRDQDLAVVAGLNIRRFLAFSWSLNLGLSGEWGTRGWLGGLGLGFLYHLPP